ncbi:MAG: preprotein translocase subunit YajC [Bacteroidetes bacterium]|jgi:preprotein translocase subunit YajC|nr:MAG: preprotein translocase subunit YajC [Bacteroidota bacterium]
MLSSILLMSPSGGQGSGYQSLIFLGLIMVVFYFFFIRPQAKKAKDLKKYREALKKGDKIITIGGIHGKIVEVQETTFTIEVEDGSRLRIEKSAVAGDASDQLANQQK